jgi:hypothetical protein
VLFIPENWRSVIGPRRRHHRLLGRLGNRGQRPPLNERHHPHLSEQFGSLRVKLPEDGLVLGREIRIVGELAVDLAHG